MFRNRNIAAMIGQLIRTVALLLLLLFGYCMSCKLMYDGAAVADAVKLVAAGIGVGIVLSPIFIYLHLWDWGSPNRWIRFQASALLCLAIVDALIVCRCLILLKPTVHKMDHPADRNVGARHEPASAGIEHRSLEDPPDASARQFVPKGEIGTPETVDDYIDIWRTSAGDPFACLQRLGIDVDRSLFEKLGDKSAVAASGWGEFVVRDALTELQYLPRSDDDAGIAHAVVVVVGRTVRNALVGVCERVSKAVVNIPDFAIFKQADDVSQGGRRCGFQC